MLTQRGLADALPPVAFACELTGFEDPPWVTQIGRL